MQMGFAKAHHQFPLEEKWVWPWSRGAPRNFGASPLIFLQRLKYSDFKFVTQLEFAKAHHKITPREKVGVALG